jgi:5-methylcytosine-specific restriction endonuclease McrA
MCQKDKDTKQKNTNLIHKKCGKSITKNKLTKKQKLVDDIFKPNKDGISEWKTRDYLSNTSLKLTNNGNCRHGKFYNDNRYIWDKKIESNTVIAIRTIGYDKEIFEGNIKRSIRKNIKDYHYKKGCVVCGCFSNLVIDHKNDLYNDKRVLNTKTQKLSDFQCLCTHCNLQKRQVCKRTKKLGLRYGATNIESLKIFGIDFISGDETIDFNDNNALKGTYWYDPVEFMKYIKSTFTIKQ